VQQRARLGAETRRRLGGTAERLRRAAFLRERRRCRQAVGAQHHAHGEAMIDTVAGTQVSARGPERRPRGSAAVRKPVLEIIVLYASENHVLK
jgi:hypothetical protein